MQQCTQSTSTNSPKSFRKPRYLFQAIYCGGFSSGEPPLPIPNREVKPTNADGTATPGGRVGSRRFSRVWTRNCPDSFFVPGTKKSPISSILERRSSPDLTGSGLAQKKSPMPVNTGEARPSFNFFDDRAE